MKVKELARRTGIPARKVRYYSQEGLIVSAREDNNYREFSNSDALNLYVAQMRRSYDIPVARLAEQDPMEWVDFRISELEEEIKEYKAMLERLKVLRSFGRMVSQDTGKVVETIPRVSYDIWNLGSQIELDEKDEEELEILAADMPYSYICVRVNPNDLCAKETAEVTLGLGMLKSVAQERGHDFCRKEHESVVNSGYHMTYKTYDPFHMRKEQVEPLLKRVEQEGKTISGDLIGRIVFSCKTTSEPEYYIMISACTD